MEYRINVANFNKVTAKADTFTFFTLQWTAFQVPRRPTMR